MYESFTIAHLENIYSQGLAILCNGDGCFVNFVLEVIEWQR